MSVQIPQDITIHIDPVHIVYDHRPQYTVSNKPSFVRHIQKNYDSDMITSAVCMYFVIIVAIGLFLILVVNSSLHDGHTHSSYYHAHT